MLRQFNEARRSLISSLNRRLNGKDEYRVALSYNSIAFYYLQKGKLDKALEEAKIALAIFEEHKAQRGIGLACITIARTLQRFGDSESLKQAETYLKRAAEIFEQRVYEPIRLIETYIELGCTYQAKMGKDSRDLCHHSSERNSYENQAVIYLEAAVKLADGYNMILYAAAYENLAHIYNSSGQLDKTERWPKRALTMKEDMKNFRKQIKSSRNLKDCPDISKN